MKTAEFPVDFPLSSFKAKEAGHAVEEGAAEAVADAAKGVAEGAKKVAEGAKAVAEGAEKPKEKLIVDKRR